MALRKTWTQVIIRILKQGDRFSRSEYVEEIAITNFVERMRFDLGEFVLHVIGVHGSNLFASWGSKHFDDLHKLIYSRFSRKQGLSKH